MFDRDQLRVVVLGQLESLAWAAAWRGFGGPDLQLQVMIGAEDVRQLDVCRASRHGWHATPWHLDDRSIAKMTRRCRMHPTGAVAGLVVK